MIQIGVVEDKSGEISHKLKSYFKDDENIYVSCMEDGSSDYDIVVWYSRRKHGNSGIKTKVLILNNECASVASDACRAAIAINWGSSERDTVVLSSSMAGGMASVQRDIETLSGKIVQPREYSLDFAEGSMEEKLVMLCIMLVTDRI